MDKAGGDLPSRLRAAKDRFRGPERPISADCCPGSSPIRLSWDFRQRPAAAAEQG
jgi:hypothetical protein